MKVFYAFLLMQLHLLGIHETQGELVEMKIVDEPSNFGLNNAYGVGNTQQEETLKLRVQPANFSGPNHFKRLLGRCFTSVIKEYKYNFCPFSNITQHEQGIHWNPYKGVLGVWQEWEVANNTFVAMLMRDGDACGSVYRSVRVSFVCGNHSKIVNVSEPHTCQYQIVFMTPLVCHKDSMLVYPSLSQDLQKQWNGLEGEMMRGELTEKGYKNGLARILEKADIFMSTAAHHHLVKKSEEAEEAKRSEGEFDSLETCKLEYKKVQERLKTLISQTGEPRRSDIETGYLNPEPDRDFSLSYFEMSIDQSQPPYHSDMDHVVSRMKRRRSRQRPLRQ